MNESRKNRQLGFTLIELLLALVFFSSLLVFATASYIRINRSYVRGANVKLVQEETRKVLEELSSAIRTQGSGSASIYPIDEDDVTECDPGSTTANVNYGASGLVSPPSTDSTPYNCRHRLCVGNTVYAWNQALLTPNIDEHSWFLDGTWSPYDSRGDSTGDPFSIIKATGSGASDDDCRKNIEFLDAVSLVDSNRIVVQDIDVYRIDPVNLPRTYMVRVSLSTRDDNPSDSQDLNFQTVPSDSQPGTMEYKAEGCYLDNGSQQFCYVETLSTIVTIR